MKISPAQLAYWSGLWLDFTVTVYRPGVWSRTTAAPTTPESYGRPVTPLG